MTESPSVTEVLVAAIREARDRDGWNARTLAKACTDAGMPQLDQSTITNILNRRRRRIGVDEWLTLAYVLRLPPAQMLLPLTTSDRAAITPTLSVGHDAALRWLLGEGPAPAPEGAPQEADAWRRNGTPVREWRTLWELTERLDEQLSDRAGVLSRELTGPDLQLDLERQRHDLTRADLLITMTLQDLRNQYQLMLRMHLSPPPPSKTLLENCDRFGVPRPEGFEHLEDGK